MASSHHEDDGTRLEGRVQSDVIGEHRQIGFRSQSLLSSHAARCSAMGNDDSDQPISENEHVSSDQGSGLRDQRVLVPSSATSFLGSYQRIEQRAKDSVPLSLPTFLRRRVLLTFALIFLVFIVALETTAAISYKHNGLSGGSWALRYLIGYGTTGVLTITAAVWSRVEYTALRSTPWLKLGQDNTSQDSLFVDYLDMWKLRVPYKALKARDYHAAATTIVSLLLTILMVLSTGLFVLRNVDVLEHDVIYLQTKFMDDATRLKNITVIPHYITAALNPNLASEASELAHAGLEYPIGLTDGFAYQTFEAATASAKETNATVDGISTGLDCQQVAIESVTGYELDHTESINDLYMGWVLSNSDMTINYEDCYATLDFTIPPQGKLGRLTKQPKENRTISLFLQFEIKDFIGSQCQSRNRKGRWLLFTFATVQYTFTGETHRNASDFSTTSYFFNATTLRGAALLCTPTYEVTQVDVSLNGAGGMPTVSRHPNALSKTLPTIRPWDIMDANLQSYELAYWNSLETSINGTEILGNKMTGAIMDSECYEFCSGVSSLFNVTVLQQMATKYYKKYSAAVIYVNLMEQINGTTTGISKRSELRLLVQTISTRSMTAILALCVLITIMMALWPTRALPIASIEPGSILSIASLAGRHLGLSFPQSLGAANLDEIEISLNRSAPQGFQQMRQKGGLSQSQAQRPIKKHTLPAQTSQYTPFVLRPSLITSLLFVLIALFITLEFTLRKSTANQGLGSAGGDFIYLHYAWTAFPAVVLALLSTWISSIDSQVRAWAPYVLLCHNEQDSSILQMDLSRDMALFALHQEFRNKRFAALAITSSTLFASVFTMATAPLFRNAVFPLSIPVQLRAANTFVHTTSWWNSSLNSSRTFPSSSLILENILPYQNIAYENLVFPAFSLHEGLKMANASQSSEASTVNVQSTVPAFRPGLSCHQYPLDMWNFTSIMPDPAKINSTNFWSSIIDSGCVQWITHEGGMHIDGITTYFGYTTEAGPDNCFVSLDLGGHDFAYAWGSNSLAQSYPSNSTVWGLGCNSTLETLNVAVSFRGPNLVLDESNPPKPIESSARRVSRQFRNSAYTNDQRDIVGAYYSSNQLALGSLPPPNNTVMDPFFQELVTSRYAIPLQFFADASQVSAVEDAIIFQHSILAAQCISGNFRVDADFDRDTGRSNATFFPALANKIGDVADTGVYEATATDPYGLERVVQDPIATRLLQVLLLATCTLILLGWVLGAWRPVLPRPPTTIASVLALLAGGNVLEHLYREDKGDCLTLEEAISRFSEHCGFRLGWGQGDHDGPSAHQRFGIWLVQHSAIDIDSDDTSLDDEVI